MNEYRELWNEAGEFEGGKSRETAVKKLNGRLLVKESVDARGVCYTVDSAADVLFDEELQAEMENQAVIALKKLLAAHKYRTGESVLVVGLGNGEITADSLGGRTARGVTVTRKLLESGVLKAAPNVASFLSSVSALTGVSSFSLIKGVTKELAPKHVVFIDTLACRSAKRLSRAIQLTDMGIVPGSGVDNVQESLDSATLGTNTYAIGVPLVIYAKNILAEYLRDNVNAKLASDDTVDKLIVTAKEIDLVVDAYARLLSSAINRALQ